MSAIDTQFTLSCLSHDTLRHDIVQCTKVVKLWRAAHSKNSADGRESNENDGFFTEDSLVGVLRACCIP